MASKATKICFTFNNPTADEYEIITDVLSEICTYAVIGKETGATGTPHLQGYCELVNKQMRLRTFVKYFPRPPHVEPCRGGRVKAAAYCKKGEQSHSEWKLDGVDGLNYGLRKDVWEFGDMPTDDSTQGKRTDIEAIREACVSGEIKNEWDLLNQVKSMQAYKFGTVFLNNMPVAPTRAPPLVYWLYGSSGSGKSLATANFVKKLQDRRGWSFWRSNLGITWFDGYNRQEVAWLDDYRWTGKRKEFVELLGLLDIYPVRVPIKGGFVGWAPRVIIITSPRAPADSFDGLPLGEDIGQLTRRVSNTFNFDQGGRDELAGQIVAYLHDNRSQHVPRSYRDEEAYKSSEDEEDSEDEMAMIAAPELVRHKSLPHAKPLRRPRSNAFGSMEHIEEIECDTTDEDDYSYDTE